MTPGDSEASGWVARHLATRAGEPAVSLNAASVGSRLPAHLRGAGSALALPASGELGLLGWPGPMRAEVANALAALHQSNGIAEALAQHAEAGQVGREAVEGSGHGFEVRVQLSLVPGTDPLVGVPAAPVDRGGFDADAGSDELGHQSELSIPAGIPVTGAVRWGDVRDVGPLEQLEGGEADMLDRVTIVIVSEFGRRVAQNASGGTDHGRAGPVFVIGKGLRGGRYGGWAGLSADVLDDGDVPVATDRRDVLAAVVARRLGNPALDRVFTGHSPAFFGFS